MKRFFLLIAGTLIFCAGCTLSAPSAPTQEAGTPLGVIPSPQPTSTFTLSPTITSTATRTPTITPSPTVTQTPTATLVSYEAGDVYVPILLYYHIDVAEDGSRFYVSPEDFREQMEYLRANKYVPISITDLILVLINGGELPARAVVITFDGGGESVYENAFPIMQETGFAGVVYVVANRLYSDGFLNTEQLSEMVAAGWQVGSQGMTHQDLTLAHELARTELLQSRLDLENALDTRVTTFAYPFGNMDGFIATKLEEYGYFSAVGLGNSSSHTWGTIYNLGRIEVQGTVSMDDFVAAFP